MGMNSKSTLLCVNDNPKSRVFLAGVLEKYDFEVIPASGPAEALAILETVSCDLALLDYHMPVMTGAELAQEIRQLNPDLPIVLMAGVSTLPDSELAGVDAFIGHGSTLDDLVDLIRRLSSHFPAQLRDGIPAAAWNSFT